MFVLGAIWAARGAVRMAKVTFWMIGRLLLVLPPSRCFIGVTWNAVKLFAGM